MFELNLIKDKAKARQRRRVIFLSIVSILFLAGLLSIFVASLWWNQSTQLDTAEKKVADLQADHDTQKSWIAEHKPKAKKRRNSLILAWREDIRVLQDRPYFTPLLIDLAKQHPNSAEFWYNSVSISPSLAGAGPRGSNKDSAAAANELLDTRSLDAQGYIEIEASDILTENELSSISKRMRELTNLVGQPRYTLDIKAEIPVGGDSSTSRYVPFTMSAAQTVFRGPAE